VRENGGVSPHVKEVIGARTRERAAMHRR
jgi:hypothetical protein